MAQKIEVSTTLVGAGPDAFEVTTLRPESAIRCVVFAAGRGGNPLRHLGLLQAFAHRGICVLAPHFEMPATPVPTSAELLERSRRLRLVMDVHCRPDLPIAGVGHSLGTVVLLVVAGAEASTLTGDRLSVSTVRRFDRLVLFTPPTDFFRRPWALSAVNVPIQVWAGGMDTITPPHQTEFLADSLREQMPVDVRLVEAAGHFTFMNELPPHGTDPHPNRDAFLRSLAEDVFDFLSV